MKTGSEKSHGDKRDLVAKSIVQWMLDGKVRAGDRLMTQELADELGVSLTPVREALAELAGVGIIDLVPNKGAVVHAFSSREIREVCRVRGALECEAVRGAVGRYPPSQLRSLHAQFTELTKAPVRGKRMVRRAQQLDSELHGGIAKHCGNHFLEKELLRLSRLFRSLRDASWVDAQSRDDCDRLAEEALEHLAITQAMLEYDKKGARLAMGKHISMSARYWSRGSRSDPR